MILSSSEMETFLISLLTDSCTQLYWWPFGQAAAEPAPAPARPRTAKPTATERASVRIRM